MLTILDILIKLQIAMIQLFEAFNQEYQNIYYEAKMNKGFEKSS